MTKITIWNKLILLLSFCILISCKKDDVLEAKYETAEMLKEIVKTRNIKRVIASDNQAFLNDLSFSEEYGFDFAFKDNFLGVYGQFWNLEYLKRYEVAQRGNTLVLLLLFDN